MEQMSVEQLEALLSSQDGAIAGLAASIEVETTKAAKVGCK
jgi:hypothetical protein